MSHETDYKKLHEQRNKRYNEILERLSPNQNTFKSLLAAFWVGGVICCLGQLFGDLAYSVFFKGITKDTAANIAVLCLIFLTVVLTGFGIYDKIGYYAGGGSFLPITGFANSISSAAIEFKSEGFIFGLSTKLFTVAGPVLVNGITASALVGLVYYIIGLF